MPDAPCQFVTERATEGPCETCGHSELCHWVYDSKCTHRHACHCSDYLGPVLKRCGRDVIALIHDLRLTEGTHAYQPPPE